MRGVCTKLGYALGAVYSAFAVICMGKMSGSVASFFDPIGLLFSLWVLSPIVFLTWLQTKSKLWWLALLPTSIFGALATYDMAFHPGSSTAALGLIFFPLYQWAFVGVIGFIILLVGAVRNSGSSSA